MSDTATSWPPSWRIGSRTAYRSSPRSWRSRSAGRPNRASRGTKAMQSRINAVAQFYDVISRSAALGPVPVEAYLQWHRGKPAHQPTRRDVRDHGCHQRRAAGRGSRTCRDARPSGQRIGDQRRQVRLPGGKGQLRIGFAKDGDDAVLTVADDGIGLNPPSTSNPSSSGLGTRFVGAFVRQLGGTQATATSSGGTTFTIRLPGSILADIRC